MYCDALTLSAVVDELRAKVLGGRIQRVTLVDDRSVGLEVFAQGQRHHLLVSAEPAEGGRVHLVPHRLRRGPVTPSPLLLRLRKHLRSSRLVAIDQPPVERILRFGIEGRQGNVVLVAEAMGRRSNILLIGEDGTILECARHVPSSQNRYRTLLPGYLYVPPPAQQKAGAGGLRPATLTKILQEQDGTRPLWQRLVSSIRGVSPLLAREVSYRAGGAPDAQDAEADAVLTALNGLFGLAASGEWEPSVAFDGGEIVAYAPYQLTHYPLFESRAGISAAMTAYYAARAGADAYAVARGRLQRIIEEQRERQLRKQESLLRAQPTSEAIDRLCTKGELLLAFAHRVSPGQQELVLDEAEAGAAARILLDPHKTAVENAQQFFRSYDKAKAAAAQVPQVLATVKAELAYLDQLATDLILAEDQPGIAAVESALAQAGYLPRGKRKVGPRRARPARVLSEDGFVVWVGRNSWQNEEVTFRLGAADDVWLHAQGRPGAHVLIRTEGRDVPPATLRRAAELAAYYSAGRQDNRVAVDHTLRRHVRRLKGGKPGQVIYRGQQTLLVSPQE